MGNPIHHSKSPAIHRLFAEQCHIALDYRAIEVALDEFEQAVRRFQAEGGAGLNVTVPFKLDAFALADRRSQRALVAQAVNTLKFEGDGEILGDNTDGIGLVRDLTRNLKLKLHGRHLLILGAGGAVRGVVGPLLEQGIAGLVVANRTVAKARELEAALATYGPISGRGFADLGAERFDVVINGTAASLTGELPPLPRKLFRDNAVAYDLMYSDEPTPFMRWAHAHGASRVADGLGMLVEQAGGSFFLWHGVRPSTKPVIKALRHQAMQD